MRAVLNNLYFLSASFSSTTYVENCFFGPKLTLHRQKMVLFCPLVDIEIFYLLDILFIRLHQNGMNSSKQVFFLVSQVHLIISNPPQLGCYLMMLDYANVFHHMHWRNSPALMGLTTHHYLPFMMHVWASIFHNMVFTLVWVAKNFFRRWKRIGDVLVNIPSVPCSQENVIWLSPSSNFSRKRNIS